MLSHVSMAFLLLLIFVSATAEGMKDYHNQAQMMTEPGSTESSSTTRYLNCIDMVKVSSDLEFVQNEEGRTLCGVFLIGDVHEIISIEILSAKLDCDNGEFIEVFDGWMARGNILPSDDDHILPMSERIADYCSWQRTSSETIFSFTSSQNVALIQFRLFIGSSLRIRFMRTLASSPICNLVTPNIQGKYTMHSIMGRNCTFSIIQPTLLAIEEIVLGSQHEKQNDDILDTIEILNGESLDPSKMTLIHRFTSPLTIKEIRKFSLNKTHSAVRMTSSGFHHNVIKFRYTKRIAEEPKGEPCS